MIAGTLSGNGKPVAQRSLPHTQPFLWAWDETFDVSLDIATSVDNSDYHVPFAFTGKLEKITFDLGETSITPKAIKAMMEELAKKRSMKPHGQARASLAPWSGPRRTGIRSKPQIAPRGANKASGRILEIASS